MQYNSLYTAKRIKELRESKGLSRETLSEKLFISEELLYSIEIGRRKPTIDILMALANIFGVSMDSLVIDSGPSKLKTNELFDELYVILDKIKNSM